MQWLVKLDASQESATVQRKILLEKKVGEAVLLRMFKPAC